MSYLVLARKWRPQKFQDVVGQKPVVRTLQNALKRNRVAHAMIFSGVRGVGKTTLARLMAKALNCHQQEDAPCDQCTSCQDVINGNALDLHEIDGASNRGIQEIRDLKENLRFMPVNERFKVVIIDEVHMLTTEAFNALLKTLEEPPEHVFFMFATTELHKVPVTILSRCQRFELKRVAFPELVTFFQKIAAQEGVEISDTALAIIATEADGSVRDGLSLLDQIFSFCGDKVTDLELQEVLGLVDRRIFAKIAAALLGADLGGGLNLLNESYNQGLDIKRFSQGLLYFFRSLLVCKTSKTPAAILDVSDQEMDVLVEMAAKYSTGTLAEIFNILLSGIDEMQYSAHPRMVLEMAFVKSVHSRDIVPVSKLLSRLDSLLAGQPQILSEACPVPTTCQPPPLEDKPQKKNQPEPEGSPPLTEAPSSPETEEQASLTPEMVESSFSESELAANEEPVGSGGKRAVQRDWDGFIAHVKDRKKWMASALGLAEKVIEEGGGLLLRYDEQSECLYLQESANMTLLTEFAQDFFQKDMTIKIEVRGGTGVEGQDQAQEARRALAGDPRVQLTMEVLGGQVTGIRTGPRSR